jgi:NADH dehydrogenase FAD-containing subunit
MGDTGVLVATHLGRSFDVVGITTKPALVSGQELGSRLADPEGWRRNYLTALSRFRKLDRAVIVHGAIDSIDTTEKLVHVEAADGHRTEVRYDLLVIASGASNGFWRHARVESLAGVEADLAAIAARIDGAGTIAVVGGGATGVSAAYNLARRHPVKEVHLFFSQHEVLPGYHPKVRRHLTRELEAVGTHLHPGHRASVPSGFRADRPTTGPITWTTGHEPFAADLVLWTIGDVRPNSAYLPADMRDEHGFVRVDEHLRVPGYPDVFAIGDVAATDPNRSSARNFGYRVLVRNMRAVAAGRTDRLKSFTAPEHRWGSILGIQDDGLTIYQPNGSRFRVPRWAVQPLLLDLITKVGIYGGIRRSTRAVDRHPRPSTVGRGPEGHGP